MNHSNRTVGAITIALAALITTSQAMHLSGRQIQAQVAPNTEINDLGVLEEGESGILILDAHNFFSCSSSDIPYIVIETGNARFWVYEFTGEEPPFNGQFFISPGELAVNPQYSVINTLNDIVAGRRYYVMTEVDLKITCGEGFTLAKYCGDDICADDENTDSCRSDCHICGDGILSTYHEKCDDSNTANLDGCNDDCEVEVGYKCEGDPSECSPLIPSLPGGSSESSSSQGSTGGGIGGTSGPGPGGPGPGPSPGPGVGEDNCRYDGANGQNIGNVFTPSEDACFTFWDNFGASRPGSKVYYFGSFIREYDSPDQITLHSVSIEGANITITYTKNFATCAHIYTRSGGFDQIINFICAEGNNQTAQANMNSFGDTLSVGDEIKICHGNNGNLCSDFVEITGPTGQSNAELFVVQKNLGTTDLAVENQKDITLLRFSAQSEGGDTFLIKSIFKAQQGSLSNMKNYALWVDTNNDNIVDTILQDDVDRANELVTFSNLAGGGYAVPENSSITFEVHGDVQSSLTSNLLQLAFTTGLFAPLAAQELSNGSDLDGVEINGQCNNGSDCDIHLSTVNSIVWNFGSQGSLFVTKDTVPLRNRQLLGGRLGEVVLRLSFQAENEDIDVTDISLINSVVINSLDRLELFKEGESVPFASATMAGCGGQSLGNVFCANMEGGQLVIPKGNEVDVIVRPRIKADISGGRSDETVQVELIHPSNGITAISARGLASLNNLSQNDGDNTAEGEVFIGVSVPGPNGTYPKGQVNVTVLSKVSSITNANPDPNGTSIPIGLSPIAMFAFDSVPNANDKNGRNYSILDRIIFGVNASNAAVKASSFRFSNKADSTINQSCQTRYTNGEIFAADNISGEFLVECIGLNNSPVETKIDSLEVFVLEAEIVNPKLNPSLISVLQVSLQNFTDINASYGAEGSHVLWFDKDGVGQATFEWFEYPESTVKSTNYNS